FARPTSPAPVLGVANALLIRVVASSAERPWTGSYRALLESISASSGPRQPLLDPRSRVGRMKYRTLLATLTTAGAIIGLSAGSADAATSAANEEVSQNWAG